MTRTEDNKVESEDNREGKEISKSLQKHTRTQHATKMNGKTGKQMKLKCSFNVGRNKMEQ